MINEKKSERAPRQTIIYLGVQIDLQNIILALPPDHVDSPLTMRGGDTFISSDSAPARVSSGSAEFCRSHAPDIVWMNTFSLASRRDDTIQVDEYIHWCTQVNKFARCSSEQVCQVLQKMMYDNCVTQI